MEKLHKNLVKTLAVGLQRVFSEGRHADPILEKLLASDSRLGSRDRRFIAENYYELVRYWRHLLRLEQDLSLDLGQDYFRKACLWLAVKGYPVSDWPECADWNLESIQKAYAPSAWTRAERHSIPAWLDELGEAELGPRWEAELAGLNQQAPVYLRANGLKTHPEELKATLAGEGVETELVPGHPDALLLPSKTNVIRLGSFRKGLYEVQDACSQLIAPYLQPQPGQTVIDACAGAGGKTLHLAALMANQGQLISMDVERWKLDELEKRAKRNGVSIVRTHLLDGKKSLRKLDETADRLLLDVPCSGLGVLRRNPDAKWKLSLDHIDTVKETQREILAQYSRMLKVGGLMVYATCSLLPSEDEKQVAWLLEEEQPGRWELLGDQHTWPSEGWDGFYMALLRKKK